MKKDARIALTGFMGVGKTSVARHLSYLLRCDRVDLDSVIEANERRSVVEIIDAEGINAYREIETWNLRRVLEENKAPILSLGGGTWTIPANRELIRQHGLTSVWLESSFEHCWYNIRSSRKERPLARNKRSAKKLFDERQKHYCLADWHFIIKPEFTSLDVARQIADEIFL
jgi:shikimate kinase